MLDARIIPAEKATAITANDSTTFAPTRGVYVGGSGDLKVTMANGSDVTFTSLSAGVIHPISCIRMYSTGTTATNLVALY